MAQSHVPPQEIPRSPGEKKKGVGMGKIKIKLVPQPQKWKIIPRLPLLLHQI